jgi:predicted O-methyltransferase YrrM
LYALLRQGSPRLVVEVGSGFSSALVLDTSDEWLRESQLVFVEPYPQRLHSLLKTGDVERAEVIESAVQDVSLEVFDRLGPGDFLIIDSTHVAKVGSDVMTLLLEVMPRLRPGVLVHVHDIFYPFEYPEEWVLEGRAWNEAYLLRAFLTGNAGYRIVLWNSLLAAFHRDRVGRQIPLWLRNTGGSLWLERTASAL